MVGQDGTLLSTHGEKSTRRVILCRRNIVAKQSAARCYAVRKAEALAADVDNGNASGNDVANELESYAKTILEFPWSGKTERHCRQMAKKARGE